MTARAWTAAAAGLAFGLAFATAACQAQQDPIGPAGATVSGAARTAGPADATLLPPCEFEDGPGPCFWDAGAAGNGVGNSFWVDCAQQIHYLDPVIDAREGGENSAPNGYPDMCQS